MRRRHDRNHPALEPRAKFQAVSERLRRGLLHRLFEIAAIEGLLQHPDLFEPFRKPGRAIATGKEEGYSALAQDFGDWEGVLSGEINIKNRKIDIRRLRHLQPRLQPHGRADHIKPEFRQIVFHKHGDEGFILDQENAFFSPG